MRILRLSIAGPVAVAMGVSLTGPGRAQSPPDVVHYGSYRLPNLTVQPTGLDHCPGPYLGNPVGMSVRAWQIRQTSGARLDHWQVHQCEWYRAGSTLGPDGKRHVIGLADALLSGPAHVFIDPSDDAKLNAARRIYVIKTLLEVGVADADCRVALGYPKAEGLYGEEAPRAYSRLLIGSFGGGMQGGTSGIGGGIGGGLGGGMGTSGGAIGIGGGFR